MPIQDTRIERTCEICSAAIQSPTARRYCSRRCRNTGIAQRRYVGHMVDVVCVQCGKVSNVKLAVSESKRFCSRSCKHEAQRKHETSPEDVARFWSKVDRSGGPDACWPWLAGVDGKGYGYIRWCGRRHGAHRVAYELANGTMPEHDGCHTCDNPPCCNPAHIFDGTKLDNMADMVAKGRSNWGENNGKCVLTEAQAIEILSVFVPGSHNYAAFGQTYGVSDATIRALVSGKTWKHLRRGHSHAGS